MKRERFNDTMMIDFTAGKKSECDCGQKKQEGREEEEVEEEERGGKRWMTFFFLLIMLFEFEFEFFECAFFGLLFREKEKEKRR